MAPLGRGLAGRKVRERKGDGTESKFSLPLVRPWLMLWLIRLYGEATEKLKKTREYIE